MRAPESALPPSLYADTAVPPIPAPPLDADKNVRVAIIGGGFTGLSTALHLAEQGVDVLVLEAHSPDGAHPETMAGRSIRASSMIPIRSSSTSAPTSAVA